MKDYNNRGRSNRSYSNDVQMHPAVCDNCGDKCQVPFKPSGNKPIYCSDCFEKMGGNQDRNDRVRDDRGGRGGYTRGGHGRDDRGTRGGYDRGGRGRDDRNKGSGRDSNYRGFDGRDSKNFPAVCDNCGEDCEVPFKPTPGKPIFCSKCFNDKNSNHTSSDVSNPIAEINEKLDLILKALKPILPVKVSEDEIAFKDKKVVRKKSDEPISFK